ncbi:hypothetical protein DXG01_000825 [Tephrocybe rancida]|nr:hypothetical protein DXG01_000825 [Tephrocybe rancida]
MAAVAGKTALLLGATGQTGQKILHELLQSPDFTKVGEYGRRLTDKSSLPSGSTEKLVQRAIDFENLGEAGLKEHKWDVVFIALGTTKKIAGSAEAFEKIDREYVVNAAREAKSSAPDQRLVYVSAQMHHRLSSILGASISVASHLAVPPRPRAYTHSRSKGLTENALAALGYSDIIVFRPAFLAGTERGPKQELLISIATPLFSLASRFSNNAQIQISTLAKSVVAAGRFGSAALPASAQATKVGSEGASFTLIDNPGALALASEGQ